MTPPPLPAVAAEWDRLALLEADFDDVWAAEDDTGWIEAAPFRAHLRHLITEYGLAWRTIAALAEVPDRCVHQLLHGRRGRPVPRVHPVVARRLYQLTGDSVQLARTTLMPAAATTVLLQVLTGRGWTVAELAARTRIPAAELQAILDAGVDRCSRLTAATVRAATQALQHRPRAAAGSGPVSLVRAA